MPSYQSLFIVLPKHLQHNFFFFRKYAHNNKIYIPVIMKLGISISISILKLENQRDGFLHLRRKMRWRKENILFFLDFQ